MSCAEQDKIVTMTPINLLASYSGSSIKNNLNEEPEPEKLKEEPDKASLVAGVRESHCEDSSPSKRMFNKSNENDAEDNNSSDNYKYENYLAERKLEGEEVMRPLNLNLDVNVKVDADINIDALTSLETETENEKVKRQVDPSTCPPITSFLRARRRHQHQHNIDTDILSLRELEKNYLFEVMPGSSSAPSLADDLRSNDEKSLSCFTQQQSLSNLDIKKIQRNKHSIKHLRDTEIAFQIYSEANSNSSCLANARDFELQEEHTSGKTNAIPILAMLQRLSHQRNELKTLDNQLLELSAHYLAQLGTNTSSADLGNLYNSTKMLLQPFKSNLLKQQQQHQCATKLEVSSNSNYFSLNYHANVGPLEMNQSNSYLEHQSSFKDYLTPIGKDSTGPIDLSQNSTKSAISNLISNKSIHLPRQSMNTESKRPQTESPVNVNLKKSRLLAANLATHLDNTNACASVISNQTLPSMGTELTSMRQAMKTPPDSPLDFTSNLHSDDYLVSQEQRHKKFRSDIYYENCSEKAPSYYRTFISNSSSRTNDLTLSHNDGDNNLNVVIPSTKTDEDDIKMMNAVSLSHQEQQYMFVKEYINQYQSMNPLIPHSVPMLVDGSSESINRLAQLPISEHYYGLLNSPTSVSSGDEEIKYCTNYAPATTVLPNDDPRLGTAAYVRATSELDRLPDLANCQHGVLTTIDPKRHQTSTHDSTYGQTLSTINKDQRHSVKIPSVSHSSTARQLNHNHLSQQKPQQQQHLSLHQQQLRVAFRCQVCGSGFEDRHRLQQHLSIHLNLDPSWFEEKTIKETMAQYELKRGDYLCSTCNLRFETTVEFDKHMQLHGDKPHQCELCNQDNKLVCFRYYRQLLTHLRSHCFLYSCRFAPDCKQTANRKDYLKLHILKHHLNNILPDQYTICCH